jgi:hypothetical protein
MSVPQNIVMDMNYIMNEPRMVVLFWAIFCEHMSFGVRFWSHTYPHTTQI